MITFQKNKLKNKTMKTTLLFILLASISFAQDQIETKYFREFYYLDNDLNLTNGKYAIKLESALPEVLRYPTKFVFKNQVEGKEVISLFINSGCSSLTVDRFQDLYEVKYLQGRIVSISFTDPICTSGERNTRKISFFYDKKGYFKKCTINFMSTMMETYGSNSGADFWHYSHTVDYLCDNSGRIIKSRFIGGALYFFKEFLTTTTYDQNNNIVKIVQSGGRVPGHDIFGKTEFEYDSQNNKIKETYDIKYLQDTTVLSKKWEYNNQNQWVKEIWYTQKNAIRFLEKHDYLDGKLVSDSIFWSSESDTANFNELWLQQESSYQYDWSGKLLAELYWHDIKVLYYYDNNGKLIEKDYLDDMEDKYAYDIVGNCISKNKSSVIYDEKKRLVNYTTTGLGSTSSNSIHYFDDQSFSIESIEYTGNSERNSMNGYQPSNYISITVNDYLFDKNGNMLDRHYNQQYRTYKNNTDSIYNSSNYLSFYQKNEFNDLDQLIKQEWFDEKNRLFYERKYKYDEFGNWVECSNVSLNEESEAFRMTRKYDQFNNLIELNIFNDKKELVISKKWKFDKNNFLLEFSQFDKNNKPLDNVFGFQKVVYSTLQDDNLSGAKYFNAEGKEVFSSSATYWQYYK
jgi:hypothetical protein